MEFLEVVENNKRKYLEYNRIKYQRFQNLLPNNTVKRIINSIPYLLSVNRKKLPGYVDGDVPLGIANYFVDENTKKFIRAKFPGAYTDIHYKNPSIEMLAVMGSVGTIAYNKKSDFDYWVCVKRENFTNDGYKNFQKKVEAVQKWASLELKVPVHLFINDIRRIRENVFAEDEDEAFGTTIGAVLKDEFLRSSIIVAGKIPFWWVLPSSVKDEGYEKFLKNLPREKAENEYIDLGNIYEISKENFLGAALFQIIKSLGNPFKSIIKLGVLEKYLYGSEGSPILSHKVKINILKGSLNNDVIDSYLFMFQEVYDYYKSAIGDKGFLDVLERSLYLKIDPQLSRYTGVKDKRNIPYKVEVMDKYVHEWGWSSQTIKELDNFENWDFNRVMKFWDSVKKFMLLSYQRIYTQLPQLNLMSKISESDFVLLNRKIKTHFRKQPNKIEQLITFKDTTYESILYVEPVSQGIREVEWMLYKSNLSKQDVLIKTRIKSEKSLLQLLVWTAINNIYEQTFTRLNIQSGYTRINQNMVIEMLNSISNFFMGDRIHIKNEYYLRPEFKLLNFIILNFNIEGADKITSVHHLYHTSWGESYLTEHESENELLQILFEVLKDGLKLKRRYEDYCEIISPEMYKKQYKSILNLFKEAYATIVTSDKDVSARFVFSMGGMFFNISRDGEKVTVGKYPSLIKLLLANNLKPQKRVLYKFQGEGMLAPLGKIYELSGKDSITVVYEERDDLIFTYLMNENGNLFLFVKPKIQKDKFLIYLYEFCKVAAKRVNEKLDYPIINEKKLKVYRLNTDRFGEVTIEDHTNQVERDYVLNYNPEEALVAYISKYMSDETFYNILFPDHVSSGFMSIKEIYSVSNRIAALRRNGMQVNGIIRDVVFSDLRKEDLVVGSTLYFLEKYKLEFMIEKIQEKSKQVRP